MARVRSKVGCRLAAIRAPARIRACVKEQADELVMAVPGCRMKRRMAACLLHIGVCACAEEHTGDNGALPRHGAVNGPYTARMASLDVGISARIEEHVHHTLVAKEAGEMKRGEAVARTGVHVRARMQELAHPYLGAHDRSLEPVET